MVQKLSCQFFVTAHERKHVILLEPSSEIQTHKRRACPGGVMICDENRRQLGSEYFSALQQNIRVLLLFSRRYLDVWRRVGSHEDRTALMNSVADKMS
jgi:hypothetical protein